MTQCQCLKTDGQQCNRQTSTKLTDNSHFCWQHQKCQTQISISVNPIKSITLPKVSPLPSSRQLQKLSGTYQFVYFNNILGKRLLFLGEQHSNTGICDQVKITRIPIYELHQWLFDLSTQSPECLDLFVEHSYLTSESQIGGQLLHPLSKYQSSLTAIKSIFSQCHTWSSQNKMNCVSDRLRYHYVDLRGFKSVSKSSLLDWYLTLGTSILYKYQFKPAPKEFKILLEYVLGMNREVDAQFAYESLMLQLSKKISTLFSLSKSRQYMTIYWKLIDKETAKLDPRIDRTKFFQILLDIYFKRGTQKLLNSLFIIPQDVYFLLRLFIRFDTKKMSRGPALCQSQDNQQIKNGIFHGGGAHTKIYIEFIQQYFNTSPLINIVQDINNQCITLSEPFDFFQKTST